MQITDILRCHTKDPDPARNHIFLFTCKYIKQFQPCFFFAFIIQFHAIRIHSHDRQIHLFLCHTL